MVLFNILIHGVLYQALWFSDSGSTWVTEIFRFKLSHGASNLSGLISWIGGLAIAVTALPYIRRTWYWVRSRTSTHLRCSALAYSDTALTGSTGLQIFYASHVVGAILFVVFGVLHLSWIFRYFAAGLAVYGIDVAYRWFQTSFPVDISMRNATTGSLINIVVPLEVCALSIAALGECSVDVPRVECTG